MAGRDVEQTTHGRLPVSVSVLKYTLVPTLYSEGQLSVSYRCLEA